MNDIKIFENDAFGNVRVVIQDGEPWFVGKDVAQVLGYKNTKDAIIVHVDGEDKRLIQRSEIATFENRTREFDSSIDLSFGDIPNRGLMAVNESGVYSLVFGSKLPEAKKFKHWVTYDILPAIRKTGRYEDPARTSTPPIPKDYPSALRALADQYEANQNLSIQNRILSGEVLSWDFDDLVNAIVRRYGNIVYHDRFQLAWKAFYKELYYKHSICLEGRKTADVNKHPKNAKRGAYKYLTEDEKPLAVQALVAMCQDAEINISDYLKKYVHVNELTA